MQVQRAVSETFHMWLAGNGLGIDRRLLPLQLARLPHPQHTQTRPSHHVLRQTPG